MKILKNITDPYANLQIREQKSKPAPPCQIYTNYIDKILSVKNFLQNLK